MSAADRLSKIKGLLKEKAQHSVKARPLFWKPAGLIQRISPSKKIQQWLSTKDSLTAKLRLICPDLEVVILSEELEIPLANETQSLNLGANEKVWVRCVVLKGKGANWVYARTVIPNFTETNPWSHLQKLGNKPLGEVLFQDKSIKRTPFTFATQTLDTWPYLTKHLGASQAKSKGYARRSVFTQKGAQLLLTEVFLPGLVKE